MTSLNSMKHYMPCHVCRKEAQIKKDSKGNLYTEKFRFCDTCEVKMLFNRLKEYEDAEEQGLLQQLECRCKDCVHWFGKTAGCTEHVKQCIVGGYMIGENGYCLYGERKV